jgi:transcriptional regulator with XRE-family HTH domain
MERKNNMSVKDRIAYRRKELGLNQTELANKAGLKPPAISQYESGARNPSYEALIKLSNALDVNTDYLISGTSKTEQYLDQKSEVIIKIVNSLSPSDKERVLDYVTYVAKGIKPETDSFYSNYLNYVEQILSKYWDKLLPINVYDMARNLGISVVEDDLNGEAEAILLNGERKVIIIDRRKINMMERNKYTIATLIGHAVIPWHLKGTYYSRKDGKSTLQTEDVEEMEARSFGAALIMPSAELKKDFSETKVSLQNLIKLARDKYHVSLFSLCNRLVEFDKKKYAVVQSEDNKVINTYQGNRPLKGVGLDINLSSNAATFFERPNSEVEIREGKVPAHYWFLDAKEDEFIIESSIRDPKYNSVFTLLITNEN